MHSTTSDSIGGRELVGAWIVPHAHVPEPVAQRRGRTVELVLVPAVRVRRPPRSVAHLPQWMRLRYRRQAARPRPKSWQRPRPVPHGTAASQPRRYRRLESRMAVRYNAASVGTFVIVRHPPPGFPHCQRIRGVPSLTGSLCNCSDQVYAPGAILEGKQEGQSVEVAFGLTTTGNSLASRGGPDSVHPPAHRQRILDPCMRRPYSI
jgi:hypothetical protein